MRYLFIRKLRVSRQYIVFGFDHGAGRAAYRQAHAE